MQEYKSYINVVKAIIIVSPYRCESNGIKKERIRRNHSRMQVYRLLINMERINSPTTTYLFCEKNENCTDISMNITKHMFYGIWRGIVVVRKLPIQDNLLSYRIACKIKF